MAGLANPFGGVVWAVFPDAIHFFATAVATNHFFLRLGPAQISGPRPPTVFLNLELNFITLLKIFLDEGLVEEYVVVLSSDSAA